MAEKDWYAPVVTIARRSMAASALPNVSGRSQIYQANRRRLR